MKDLLLFVLLTGMGRTICSVRGTVYDSDGSTPVSDATITFGGISVTSDASGNFSFDCDTGLSGNITCTKTGYTFTSISVSTITGSLTEQDFTNAWYAFGGIDNAWEKIDLVDNFGDGTAWGTITSYDGKYLYVGPGSNYNGDAFTALKYDTTKELTDISAWEIYDTDMYSGFGTFDGRYIYYPYTGGSQIAFRYDTFGEFDDINSWEEFNLSAVSSNLKYSVQCSYDGTRYVYYCNGVSDGRGGAFASIVKYDTWSSFTQASSWSAMTDTRTINANFWPAYCGFFNGKLYLQSTYLSESSSIAYAVEYDPSKPINQTSSYTLINLYSLAGNSILSRPSFDGRYIYWGLYWKYQSGYVASGIVLRYDTQKSFSSISSWEVVNLEAYNSRYRRYTDGVYDGSRYMYFFPLATYENGATVTHYIARYDTTKSFTDISSWNFYDHYNNTPYTGDIYSPAYNGRYIYYYDDWDGTENWLDYASITKFDTGMYGNVTVPEYTRWWKVTGSPDPIAVYKPKGANSLAESYVNIINPGVHDLTVGVAPTWTTTSGWIGNGAKYLKTDIVPTSETTVIVKFSDAPSDATALYGYASYTPTNSWYTLIFWGNAAYMWGDNVADRTELIPASGVIATTGNELYYNGVYIASVDGTFGECGTMDLLAMHVGDDDSHVAKFTGKVQAVAIYDQILTSGQIYNISTLMAGI